MNTVTKTMIALAATTGLSQAAISVTDFTSSTNTAKNYHTGDTVASFTPSKSTNSVVFLTYTLDGAEMFPDNLIATF